MSNADTQSIVFEHLEDIIKAQSPEHKSIEEALIAIGTPVISVAVLDHGSITAQILGSPSRPSSPTHKTVTSPAYNNDTLFQACSISKPITALAVIKLCQEGTLDLDAPISTYLSSEQLSWISTRETLPLVSNITLRLLLSHTSGLSCHGFEGYHTSAVPTLEQTLRGLPPANHEPVKLVYLPGQKFVYSGGGIQVVQMILETTLRKPFHQIMHETVLRPLGMTRSSYKFLDEQEGDYAPAYLTGLKVADPDHYFVSESAAAGLWTTPSDLLRAVSAVQTSVANNGFLDKTWASEMLTEVESNGMALGWRMSGELNIFGHAGDNNPGYHCYVAGFVEHGNVDLRDCGVCVMTSSALGPKVLGKIVAAVAYLKGWPSLFASPTVPFVDHARVVDESAKGWCGKWGRMLELVWDDGLLVGCGKFEARLISAVIPPVVYEEGPSVDLVADGLEMMVRLGWKDGARIVEIWQAGLKEVLTRSIDGAT